MNSSFYHEAYQMSGLKVSTRYAPKNTTAPQQAIPRKECVHQQSTPSMYLYLYAQPVPTESRICRPCPISSRTPISQGDVKFSPPLKKLCAPNHAKTIIITQMAMRKHIVVVQMRIRLRFWRWRTHDSLLFVNKGSPILGFLQASRSLSCFLFHNLMKLFGG